MVLSYRATFRISAWTTFMSKRSILFHLLLPPRESDTPAFRWLYAALRAEILAGGLCRKIVGASGVRTR